MEKLNEGLACHGTETMMVADAASFSCLNVVTNIYSTVQHRYRENYFERNSNASVFVRVILADRYSRSACPDIRRRPAIA